MKKKRILTVVGARPQFIKAATVSRAIGRRDDIEEIIVHTGQHFDKNMSEIFFEELDIPKPNYNLHIAGNGHGAMTGRMLERIEELLFKEKPSLVMVYGDTNSTLAGALAASKLLLPVAHVEAGLRSYNPEMPEEVNRVLTDRVSTYLMCPTKTALLNLEREGFPFPATTLFGNKQLQFIDCVGDVMFDAVLYYREKAIETVDIDRFGLTNKDYALCTIHRQENTDNIARLRGIIRALSTIAKELPVLLPLHPRTKIKLEQQFHPGELADLILIQPVSYIEMQRLQMSARVILTDSGGVQKEAYFHKVPCITLRDETEWDETLAEQWNQLAGSTELGIVKAFRDITEGGDKPCPNYFGDGDAAEKISNLLANLDR